MKKILAPNKFRQFGHNPEILSAADFSVFGVFGEIPITLKLTPNTPVFETWFQETKILCDYLLVELIRKLVTLLLKSWLVTA